MKRIITLVLLQTCLAVTAQSPWDLSSKIIEGSPYEKCFEEIYDDIRLEDYSLSYEKSEVLYSLLGKSQQEPLKILPDGSPKFDSLKSFYERNNVKEMVFQLDDGAPIKKFTYQPHKYSFSAKYYKVYSTFIPSENDPSKHGFNVHDTVWYEEEFSPSSEVETDLQPEDFAFSPYRVFTELEKDRIKKEFDTAIFNPDGTINLLGKFNSTDRFKSHKEYLTYEKNYMDSIHRLTESKLYFREFFLRKQNFTEEQLNDIWKHLKKIKSPPLSYSYNRNLYLKTIRFTKIETMMRASCKVFRITHRASEIISVENYYFDGKNEWIGFSEYEYSAGKTMSDSIAVFKGENKNLSRIEHFYFKYQFEPHYLNVTHFEYFDNRKIKKVSVCGLKSTGYLNNTNACAMESSCDWQTEYSYDTNGNLIEVKRKYSTQKITYTSFNRPQKVECFSPTKDSLEMMHRYLFLYEDTLLQKVQMHHAENAFTSCHPYPQDYCYFQVDEKGIIISSDLYSLFYTENKIPLRVLKTTASTNSTYEGCVVKMDKKEKQFNYDEMGWSSNLSPKHYEKLYFTYNK